MALDLVALRAAGVGDLLTAVPALRSLGHHGASLTLAAPRWLHPLAPLLPGVTNVVDVDGLVPKMSLAGSVAFNLHGSGPQSHRALLAQSPRDLIAFRCPPEWEFGPAWFSEDRDEPERHRFARLLEWVGIPVDGDDVSIRVPDVVPAVTGAVVLHLGGTDRMRRWPPESFAAVARSLDIDSVVFTGGPGDVSAAHQAAALAGVTQDHVLAGRLTLDEFAALVAAATLVVSGDTGGAHLAYAYRTPSVVIFGPASVGQWGPPPATPCRIVRGAGTSPPASDVGVEDVIRAAQSVLEYA